MKRYQCKCGWKGRQVIALSLDEAHEELIKHLAEEHNFRFPEVGNGRGEALFGKDGFFKIVVERRN